jgi:hypothetical protein
MQTEEHAPAPLEDTLAAQPSCPPDDETGLLSGGAASSSADSLLGARTKRIRRPKSHLALANSAELDPFTMVPCEQFDGASTDMKQPV